MLAKVDDGTVSCLLEYIYKTVNFTTANAKDAETQHFNFNWEGEQLKPVLKYTPKKSWGSNINMTFTYYIWENSWTGTWYLINTDASIYNVEQTFTWNYLNVSQWDECYFHIASNDRTYWYLNNVITSSNTVDFYAKQTKIYKNIFTHKCLPRQLKTIGNKALGTLFGMHVDNTRYTGDEE